MASSLNGRIARLEITRPAQQDVPEILESDPPELACKKYKELVGMRGQLCRAPDEVSEITQEEARELYYAAVPAAHRPAAVVSEPAQTATDPELDGYEWLDGYEEWQDAHPGELYADRNDAPQDVPEILEHCEDEQPEPPQPLVAVPISDQDDWLIL